VRAKLALGLVALLCLALTALAQAEVTQRGNLRVSFDGKLSAHALPRTGTAPVRVSVAAKIATTDAKAPPQLRAITITIAINCNGHFESKGLPICPLRETSDHTLPDLVFALRAHGIGVDLAGRIDSVKGGIRGSFETVPDAPVSKFVVVMNGGRRGVLVNAANLCAERQQATARFIGHNNRGALWHPPIKARCARHAKGRSR
jgi:hypothetical protein